MDIAPLTQDFMRRVALSAALLVVSSFRFMSAQDVGSWAQHDLNRPQPPIVDPGPFKAPPGPPSDALILFAGASLERWRSADKPNEPARWKMANGYLEVVPGTGAIATKQGFGDVQLHIEWAAPTPAKGEGQERGNSGVFLMGMYEVQVLDSYRNKTYPDGQAGAVYGQYPPLVNASRPPGEWQTYDIVFHGPRFDAGGKLLRPARMTVIFNGVLVQDNVVLTGPTAHQTRPPYAAHPEKLPISLQDHGNPMRFRNIWVREIK